MPDRALGGEDLDAREPLRQLVDAEPVIAVAVRDVDVREFGARVKRSLDERDEVVGLLVRDGRVDQHGVLLRVDQCAGDRRPETTGFPVGAGEWDGRSDVDGRVERHLSRLCFSIEPGASELAVRTIQRINQRFCEENLFPRAKVGLYL